MPPLLLLTRPRAQSDAFAEALGADDCEVVVAPLTEIVPLDWDRSLAEGVAGVILTSANAVPAVAGLAPLPAYCVGGATARAAAAAGFATTASGGDAAALVADLARLRPSGPLLHAHGRHLARDLVAALGPLGLTVRAAPVYEARPVPWPPGLAARLARRRVVAPVFSPRGAAELSARLAEVGGDLGPGSVVLAISAAAADRLSPALRARSELSDGPGAMADHTAARLRAQP